MIRTLIVDDGLLARKKLHALLASEPDIQVIAECKAGAEAKAALQHLKPDLLFLDIQMPEADGFQVVEAILPGWKTIVIFTTAHDKYAIRAFDAHAFDYLLKPFDQGRIHAAMERVRMELSRNGPEQSGRHMFEWMVHPDSARGNNQRLVFKTGGRILFLDVDEIDWIEASANYVQLHAGSQSYSLRETIAHILERLHSWRFVRIHRSLIVNINRIKELQPCNSGEYIVVLKDGKELSCSRGYRSGLQNFIGNL